MKRVCFLQVGSDAPSYLICCDSDHNGLNEIIFERYLGYYLANWEVWEYRPTNRYELVFADTGAYPLPPGITTGNFTPYDVGDIDRDSLTDLTGMNIYKVPDTTYNIVPTQESPNYYFYPQSLSWYYRFSHPNFAWSSPVYFTPDLDNDGRKEIICRYYGDTYIFENLNDNQNQLVWISFIPSWSIAFGDFDFDGGKEFVTAHSGSTGLVSVYENIADNQYEQVYQDSVYLPNGGGDVFSGNDLDGDGYPEFFIAFYSYPAPTNYLYMWEATGNNTYQRTLIDQVIGNDWSSKRSKCGDIDGDGVEELVWSIGGRVMVYKATGNNQFQRVWEWYNDHGGQRPQAQVNIYDMNNNGYNEIVVGGSGKTSIFEVEAVRLIRPNGGEVFQDSSQEIIRWQKFYPPRCDSLSLFYSINNGTTYFPIVSGISGSDTSYLWTVPSVNSDSCKIKIIAYGPGWQYDESDGNFSITSTGINEIASPNRVAMTLSVKVFPNPARSISVVRYSLPAEGKVSLQFYDISGRLVKTLVDEDKKPGNYSVTLNSKTLSSGIYFLSLQTDTKRIIERLVVIK